MQQAEAAEHNSRLWDLITGPEAKHWSRILVRDHLSPQTRLALFQACRDGKDLVLGAAKHAMIKLTLAADEDQLDMLASMASMQAVKIALLTRGNLPTMLQLTATTPWLMAMVPGLLGDPMITAWLGELDLVVQAEQRMPAFILATLARACPNLRALGISASPEAMPRPQLFPKLQHLGMYITHPANTEAILRSTAPYMKQLRALALRAVGEEQPPLDPTHLPLLLNPTNTGTHLRNLKIHAALDDALLGLLLECAPALTHLKVHAVRLASDTHAQSQAAWRQLEIQSGMHLSSLARLPLTTGMRLIMGTILVYDMSHMTTAQVESWVQGLLSRVKDLVWTRAGYVTLCPPVGLPADDQPAALRVGLSLLRTFPSISPKPFINLHGWDMTPALLLELPLLPPWRMLWLFSPFGWLPQAEVYSTLLRLLPGSFREVHIMYDPGLTPAHYESICLGAPRGRTPEAPLRIRLQGCEPGVVDGIQQRMQQLGVYPNVVVGFNDDDE